MLFPQGADDHHHSRGKEAGVRHGVKKKYEPEPNKKVGSGQGQALNPPQKIWLPAKNGTKKHETRAKIGGAERLPTSHGGTERQVVFLLPFLSGNCCCSSFGCRLIPLLVPSFPSWPFPSSPRIPGHPRPGSNNTHSGDSCIALSFSSLFSLFSSSASTEILLPSDSLRQPREFFFQRTVSSLRQRRIFLN